MNSLKIAQESMDKGERIVEMLEQFGLFWNVNKVKLLTPDEEPTSFYGTQREDTRCVFATVKEGYKVLQNWELAEMVTEVAGNFDMKVAKGGMFDGGAKVYLQVHSGDINGLGENNDTIKKYITALNSHDGSRSVGFGKTNVTISCQNTFHQAYRQVENKFRHSASMRDRIDAMMRDFEKLQVEEKSLYDTFFKLASEQATPEHIKDVVKMSTGIDLNLTQEQASANHSTYQINQAKQLTGRITEEMSYKGQTLWGLFSGVTKYTNRDIRVANRENATLESKFLGTAGKIDNNAMSYVAKQIKLETV